MKVCFYTNFEVSPQKGGTERITHSISEILTRCYGVQCYSIYSNTISKDLKRSSFEKKIKICYQDDFAQKVKDFIIENDLNIIIIQGDFTVSRKFREAINMSQSYCKLIFVHHFNPGAEVNFKTVRPIIDKIRKKQELLKNCIKLLLFPLLKYQYVERLPKMYKQTYENVDKVVLLSSYFIDDFVKYAKLTDSSKIAVINNMLSFDEYFDMNLYERCKKKNVLIVSRLEETQKRISLALKIWSLIEKNQKLSDWNLLIVGDGRDALKYKKFVQKHNLKRVHFEGVQNPVTYYKHSSLFMLTSSFEGWGLTLTEAQQFGCIPLAFDTYASLKDIIDNDKNGIIVKDNDIYAYASQLESLILNEVKRKYMASFAIEYSKMFAPNIIGKKWYDLFMDILNENNHVNNKMDKRW